MQIGAAAIFVAEEGLYGLDYSSLAHWVENQPAWSDLPFIVLTSRQEQPSVAQWRQRLVVALRNVSLLERPVQSITLTSSVRAALRARTRQYEVRDLLEAREQAARELEAIVVTRTSELLDANNRLQTQIDERARVEEALRQSQKMEALGQLTGGIAHDFNNLLTVILGGIDLLDRVPAKRASLLEGMRTAALRGASLTRQLLAFSRRQPLKPEPVDLAHQIGGMRDLLDGSLAGNVDVRVEITDTVWPVEVDPAELELGILNLAVNARDAMPEGGVIVIRAENLSASAEHGGGDFVMLSVVDTGTGMTPEIQAHVFEPFFTTKDIGKGSGLGLAQVYGFAKASGGTVKVESLVGQGTCICLVLPRSSKLPLVARSRAVEDRPSGLASCQTGSVLLVEDDGNVAALVADMLRQLGYEVTLVSSASAALGALANGRNIDLIFSDVMMAGGMDGVELAQEIRRQRNELPILLTTGFAESAQRAASIEGINVLPKPYSLTELELALKMTMRAA